MARIQAPERSMRLGSHFERPFSTLCAALVGVAISLPADATASDIFAERVALILQRRCVKCHNESARKSDFSLQTAHSTMSRGVIVRGDAEASDLFQRLIPTDGQAEMPKNEAPLTPEEIDSIRQWIDQGASWPENLTLKQAREVDFDWWSYRPITRPRLPQIDDDWIRNPVDAFVLHRLKREGLTPAQEADRRTLIRRVTYDLIGLPPSPAEVAAFVSDPDPWAYDRLIDRLLSSNHYGERWARHWLDVVKYADTCGYDKDKLRPNAWPYRDYVIRSFNEGKPYSRFVQEQIAGDVLFPEDPEGILGLGFIAAGPWDFIGHVEVSADKIDGQVARNLDRDDMVSNTMNTFCSVTVQCARCHDHKFDPIRQQHYYGLQGIFAAVDRADRPYNLAETRPGRVVYAAATHFKPQSNFKPTKGTPREIRVLHRGSVLQPGKRARPGVLPLSVRDRWSFDSNLAEGDRRAELARWLTRDSHPLVWRSIVNRVWQYHFGQGIVSTANDFGRMGEEPSHPRLLDWLATEFRDHGQSFKALHRLIVCSNTYRQSSQATQANLAIDGGNKFLWHMNRRRLEAEEIRDSILSVSGTLDLRMGGPGYYLFELERPQHSPHYEYHKFNPMDRASHRRSIYRFIVRSQPDPWMTTLDCADSSQSTPRRLETLTSLQALSLLNSRFNLAMAEEFAKRLEHDARPLDRRPQENKPLEVASDQLLNRYVDRALRLITQREPEPIERRELTAYAAQHGMPNLCRLLFNLSEFVYVD